jgi:hypothetical protein
VSDERRGPWLTDIAEAAHRIDAFPMASSRVAIALLWG